MFLIECIHNGLSGSKADALFTPALAQCIPSPLAGEGQGEGELDNISATNAPIKTQNTYPSCQLNEREFHEHPIQKTTA